MDEARVFNLLRDQKKRRANLLMLETQIKEYKERWAQEKYNLLRGDEILNDYYQQQLKNTIEDVTIQ